MATIQIVTSPVTIAEDGRGFTWQPFEDLPVDRYLLEATKLSEVIMEAKAQMHKFQEQGQETITTMNVIEGRSPRGFKDWYRRASPIISDPKEKGFVSSIT